MIDRYNLNQADDPGKTERDCVCIYYQESLIVHLTSITSLKQCLFSKGNIQNKKGYVAVMYLSPSQNNNEFDDFIFEVENMVNELP